ncbi:MAG: malate dehydrogenase (quinone) [Janthinobacterium lividum]
MIETDQQHSSHVQNPDVLLVGSGIMSASVAVMLRYLAPSLRIQLYEASDELSQESSHGWNNAGTGHAGLCELSYTPHRSADGSVDVSKAVEIFEQFEFSRQFWSFAVQRGILGEPKEFIRPIPHMSFVSGAAQVPFLRARYEGMRAHHFFREMEYTSDRRKVEAWAPLLMDGRGQEPVAATRASAGTDVNFGTIARSLVRWLATQPGCGVATSHRVTDLTKSANGWDVAVHNLKSGARHRTSAKFVFLGAGGGSLPLLQRSGIPESRGIGGFPIGGQWLVCQNPEVIAQHSAKVYGQALGAAPTMAVPHLDTRVLDGKTVLLFGPYAAWTSKFLHGKGSPLDLPRSIRSHNLITLLQTGTKNLDLIRYLRQQGMQSKADRLNTLRSFYPAARLEDWGLVDAGIRVQAIKKTDGQAGIVHYGTEIVMNREHSLAALLGASPGASVSAHIALNIIKRCLPALLQSPSGQGRMAEMIPIWNVDIKDAQNSSVYEDLSDRASQFLQLS